MVLKVRSQACRRDRGGKGGLNLGLHGPSSRDAPSSGLARAVDVGLDRNWVSMAMDISDEQLIPPSRVEIA